MMGFDGGDEVAAAEAAAATGTGAAAAPEGGGDPMEVDSTEGTSVCLC